MKKIYATAAIALTILVSGCSKQTSEVARQTPREMTEASNVLLKNCMSSKEMAICDTAIASLEHSIPLLKEACTKGDEYSCGLFPGYDQQPDIIRQFEKYSLHQ
jgi:hypothetical protein